MRRVSYWVIPILSAAIWLITLLALLLYWLIHENRALYPSMSEGQRIAFISDVGASGLKPLFVTACVLTMLFLDLSLAADWWLRRRGRLAPNTDRMQKVLFALTLVMAVVGSVGLICLSVFDTIRYEWLHRVFLLVFIAGFVLSAIFLCWEFRRLKKAHQEITILRRSFYIKLAFVIIEFTLSAAFMACLWVRRFDPAAVLEWIIAVIFSAFILSFVMDLYPAAAKRTPASAAAATQEKESRDVAARRSGSSEGNGAENRAVTADISSDRPHGDADEVDLEAGVSARDEKAGLAPSNAQPAGPEMEGNGKDTEPASTEAKQ
ncbi:hypothetical protein VTJ04DRAFT_7940 [Mycothermus thermophilus]|uniref:uncharacterized protein n=1 Tax=Humicola insolens TaxID=85995 RepID=UPI003742C1F3